MPENADAPTFPARPRQLLTQNRELKAIGVWNWTLPAWAGRLADGRTFNTCPSAGICARVCYARQGTYLWPVVRAKHHANLAFVLDDLPGWEQAMVIELAAKRFGGAWIRIHDSGDFSATTTCSRGCGSAEPCRSCISTPTPRRSTGFGAWSNPTRRLNFLWVYSYGYLSGFTCCSRAPT